MISIYLTLIHNPPKAKMVLYFTEGVVHRCFTENLILKDEGESTIKFCFLVCSSKNTVIPPNFLVWKFCGKGQFPHSFGQFARKFCGKAIRPKLCGNCAFPQNFHTRKLGEIAVFFAVIVAGLDLQSVIGKRILLRCFHMNFA